MHKHIEEDNNVRTELCSRVAVVGFGIGGSSLAFSAILSSASRLLPKVPIVRGTGVRLGWGRETCGILIALTVFVN
jgi:hypothetical protein